MISWLYSKLDRNGYRSYHNNTLPYIWGKIQKVFKYCHYTCWWKPCIFIQKNCLWIHLQIEALQIPRDVWRELQAGNFLQGEVNCYQSCHLVKGMTLQSHTGYYFTEKLLLGMKFVSEVQTNLCMQIFLSELLVKPTSGSVVPSLHILWRCFAPCVLIVLIIPRQKWTQL